MRLPHVPDASELDIALIGIVPEVTTMGLELSPAVAAALPAAVLAVVAALERFGVPVRRRLEPLAPAPWWNAGGAGILPQGDAAGNPARA